MGLLVKAAKGVEQGSRKTGHGAVNVAKRFPKTTAAAGGYAGGVTHSAWVHSNPEFYDRTPNNGRAEDKHPRNEY